MATGGSGVKKIILIFCSPEVKFSDALVIFEKKYIVLCNLRLKLKFIFYSVAIQNFKRNFEFSATKQ